MPDETTEASTSSTSPTHQISRVAVKIPPFWSRNVSLWFHQVECQFAIGNITNEVTKYHYVMGSLDSEIASLVSDFISKPMSTTPYSDLKKRLATEFEESEGRKARKLLNELDLGDKKPTALLREMRSLAGNQVTDDFLMNIFIQRLPTSARTVLAATQEVNLDTLAVLADKIMELSPSTNYVCSQENKLSDLKTQIKTVFFH